MLGWSGNQSLKAMRCVGILGLHNIAKCVVWWQVLICAT
jgi:hypothetical protein